VTYLLVPPTVDEAPIGIGPLFSRYGMPRGVSLLVTGNTVVEQRWPDQDQIAAADVTYLGGHEYVITDAAAQILIDAGYADCVEATDRYVDTYEEKY
jgi:hypothetical protein